MKNRILTILGGTLALAVSVWSFPRAISTASANMGNIALSQALATPSARRDQLLSASVDHLEQATRWHTGNAAVYRSLGLARFAQGNLAQASRTLEEAHGNPDRLAHFRLGNIYQAQGRSHEADAAWRAAEADVYFLTLGRAAMLKGMLADAERALQAAVRINPAQTDGWYTLGLVYRNRSQQLYAADAFSRFMQLSSPESPRFHTSQGLILAMREQWDSAAVAFRKAIALEPNDPDANDGLLKILLFRQRDYGAALEQARRMLTQSPDSLWLHLQTGLAYQGRGDLAEASRWFEKAQSMYPNDENPPVYLAGNYLERKMPGKAIESLKQSIRLNPANPNHYDALSAVYRQTGQSQAAAAALLEAIRLAPMVPDYQNRLGDVYWESSRWDLAREAYRKVLQISPDEPHARERIETLSSR